MSKIDIHEPVYEICKRLGFDAKNVRRLNITPTAAGVEVYNLRDGVKYIGEGKKVAIEEHTFEVTT